MKKKERYIILSALEGVCCSTMNGDYPAAESSDVILSLCSLFDKETLLENINPEYHDALWAYGGLKRREAITKDKNNGNNILDTTSL